MPGLAVIMAGDDPASRSYVNSKSRLAEKLGIRSELVKLPENVAAEEIIGVIEARNSDPLTHAILVQMPLPARLDSWNITRPYRAGKGRRLLPSVQPGADPAEPRRIFPCTPCGVMKILDHYGIDPAGLNAAVVGRSFLVGKPMAAMLANRNATVTLCHSRTVGLAGDPARGRPGRGRRRQARFHQRRHGQAGRRPGRRGHQPYRQGGGFRQILPRSQYEGFKKKGYAITGDIHYQAYAKAAHYTPVPGGVGPLTVTMLMHNTVELCKRSICRNE